MKISDSLLPEFDHEVATTRRVLERVPDGKFGWTPHEKSMTLGRLANHVAELPFFALSAANSDSLDFSKGDYKPLETANSQQLVAAFDKMAADARAAIAGMSDADMMKPWSLMMDGKAVVTLPKVGLLRSIMMNHLIHHRGQLSVYLRLAGAAVPSIYGPSADEGTM